MDRAIAERLSALGLELPEAAPPRHPYEPVTRLGAVLFVSGQTPKRGGAPAYRGRLGEDVDVEVGREAARLAALHCLAVLEAHVGLERVEKIAKVNGYVASGNGFVDQPSVVNGASEAFVDVLGEAGKHARTAIGVSWLPGNVPVELEVVAQARDGA